jgi:hypothetical protein
MNTALITALIAALAAGIPVYAWAWHDQTASPQKRVTANPERELLWRKRPKFPPAQKRGGNENTDTNKTP